MDELNVSVLKASTSSESSISPWWDESVFGDWCCGEPLTRQHLVVDFTPSDGQDTEYVQQKCCDFWRLVANSPELEGFKLLPEPQLKGEDSTLSTNTPSFDNETLSSRFLEPNKTAISVLEFTEDQGIMQSALQTYQPVSCSATSREYHENEPTGEDAKARADDMKKQTLCKCDVKTCQRKKPRRIEFTLPEIKRLNKTLDEWGHTHPKSMEPPGRTPILSHSVMQRNILE